MRGAVSEEIAAVVVDRRVGTARADLFVGRLALELVVVELEDPIGTLGPTPGRQTLDARRVVALLAIGGHEHATHLRILANLGFRNPAVGHSRRRDVLRDARDPARAATDALVDVDRHHP